MCPADPKSLIIPLSATRQSGHVRVGREAFGISINQGSRAKSKIGVRSRAKTVPRFSKLVDAGRMNVK